MSGGQVSFVKYVSRVCKTCFHILHSRRGSIQCCHNTVDQSIDFHMGFKELSCSARYNSTRTCSVCILTAKLKHRQVLKQATHVFVAW